MAKRSLPPFLADLVADQRSRNALLAAVAALFAAGLDPKVLTPNAMSTQAAIRAQPEIEGQVIIISVTTAILLLIGGAIGDTTRARPIIAGGLIVSFAAAFFALLLEGTGIPFMVVRFLGIASSAFVMPCALAIAATTYTGVARATAIGIAYAGYGLGQGLSPVLVALIPGTFAPAFIGSMVGCALALVVLRRRMGDLQRATRAERPYVLGTALWAAGVVLIASGLLWLGAGWQNPLRLGLIASGIVVVIAFFAWERRRRMDPVKDVAISRRPVTVALFVGLVIAMAQIVPMSQLPMYFGVVLKFGPTFGVLGLVPLFLSLILVGPIAGYLLTRYQPRFLVAAGMLVIGLGDLILALLIGPDRLYLLFILPLFLVGGGFVVATTVRTAIIFSAVPRGLPATAGALNEASIEVGTRIGIVVATALVTQVSVFALTQSLAGQPAAVVNPEVTQFRDLLVALGTGSWTTVSGSVGTAELRQYALFYLEGLRVAMLAGGLVAVAGSAVAWFGIRRGNPLDTVYNVREEPAPAQAAGTP